MSPSSRMETGKARGEEVGGGAEPAAEQSDAMLGRGMSASVIAGQENCCCGEASLNTGFKNTVFEIQSSKYRPRNTVPEI